ncbi:hypothetical protein I4U23_002884 [Adineta vaga]|nr:hypothetical protein I4U23_002884 [Adineta vaga]
MNVSSNYVLPTLHFDNETFTLKEFLANSNSNRYKLPIVVNITSLNNYGRSVKNILTKNTPLVLLEIDQLDSVIADYYSSPDGRAHSQRNRLPLPLSHNKMVSKSTAKIRNIKNLSKSVANLSAGNQINNINGHDYPDDDDDDDNAYNLRAFLKLLNEKRSSSVSICRIPVQYSSFFELLNANGESVKPYTKLSDLSEIESDHETSDKHTEKTPVSIFLRSSCKTYMEKKMPDYLRLTTNENNSNLTASVDSCYGSSSELDSYKNAILLDEIPEILSAGETIVLLDNCYARRIRTIGEETDQRRPIAPSSPHFSPVSWMRATSKLFSSKKHRSSNASSSPSNENIYTATTFETFEHYMKCQTKQGSIVYIAIDEPILFSPLTCQSKKSRTKASFNYIDTSDVFKIKDLLSNFRFPIDVRLLDGSLSFENIYTPAVFNRLDNSHLTPNKFRLLGSHNERVIFVCPLNKVALKASKSPISFVVIPLSINADIEIQPAINMSQIENSVGFDRIVSECSQIIKYYKNEIILVHFPLSLTVDINQDKQALYKKRSQSESFAEFFEEDLESEFQQPAQLLQDYRQRRRHSDEASYMTACSLHNQDSENTLQQKPSLDTVRQQSKNRRSGQHVRIKDQRKNRDSESLNPTVEDQIYQDVDKIYDYIRTGDKTEEVREIIAKEPHYENVHTRNAAINKFNPCTSAICLSPGKMVTHRFSPKVTDSRRQGEPSGDGDDDGNIDNERARDLYIAQKQRKKAQSQQDLSHSHSVTKMKKISKH